MPKISIVINCDTRPERNSEEGLFNGVCNTDFLTDGVYNKIKFFEGFDKEVIVFIDEHLAVPDNVLEYLRKVCDTVVVRKHTDEPGFNDINYFSALALARGEYIAHFDQDTAAFTSSPEPVQRLINLLDDYDFVSYPSYWSPSAVHDDSFNYRWASTRFFLCKRGTLDFTELIKCRDYDYYIKEYNPLRVCGWTEHWLGNIAKKKGREVFYPALDLENYTIFSWGSYTRYLLMRLNEEPYEKIKEWLYQHPIHYPVDVDA